MLLMPLLYFPSLPYMALLHAAREVYIEEQENYIKSTFRNRCEINGSNGAIELSIPLLGGRDHHDLYRDKRISYGYGWQHRHRMSIVSCYGSAPFFEHYMPYLEPFFTKKHSSLFDLNKEILETMIRLMKLDVKLNYTKLYEKEPAGMTDLRSSFKPGVYFDEVISGDRVWDLAPVSYMAVFPDGAWSLHTSCLDLLFNEGPGSSDILEQIAVERR